MAELDGSGNLTGVFVYGTKPNVPDYVIKWPEGTPTIYRIISDHLGSPVLAVNIADSTDIPFGAEYGPFGQRTLRSDPDSADWLPFGFAGGLIDPETIDQPGTRLVRFGARDYDPMTGRWTTKDPIRFKGGQANLYVYVGADPVNRIDPAGRETEWWQDTAQCAAEVVNCVATCSNPATRPECGVCMASTAHACSDMLDHLPERRIRRPRDDWEGPEEWPEPSWEPDSFMWEYDCRHRGRCMCLETWEGPEG